ncbi:MAG: EAL domain-containing protein [Rhodospirillales bacterium]|nr:EAL domain-containing protein [Rhodospirillales bacterium]
MAATTLDKARKNRDRFLALALAGAEVLLEVDERNIVVFAVGTVVNLLGRGARAIEGRPVNEIIVESDWPVAETALARMREGRRVADIALQVAKPNGERVRINLSGHGMQELNNRLFLAVSHQYERPQVTPPPSPDHMAVLPDREAFAAIARARLEEAARGGLGYTLTLLDMPELARLRQAAGPEAAQDFVTRVGDYLLQASVGGDSAGRLDANKYGVVHSEAVDPEAIKQQIAKMAAETAPKAPAMTVRSSVVALDAQDISEEEAVQALVYTINQFSKREGAALTVRGLDKGISVELSSTVKEMSKVKSIVEKGGFDVVFQPVISLTDHAVHHFECLSRIHGEGGGSPFKLVTFAEDTGLITQLDRVILERVAGLLHKNFMGDRTIRLAVNLSGRSLTDGPFIRELRAILANYPPFGPRLLFEMTESAEVKDFEQVNAIIQELRQLGHPVCLDDFGAGAAAFHYLRRLTVDFVKIDGSYILKALTDRSNIPFLKAIASLCRDLKIAMIGEMIEDKPTADLLRELGVQFGQGYYFGRPSGSPLQGAGGTKGKPVPDAFIRKDGRLYWAG